MKRVVNGECKKRLRNSVADQLTENPESDPLGVSAFWPMNPQVHQPSGGAESAGGRGRWRGERDSRSDRPRSSLFLCNARSSG